MTKSNETYGDLEIKKKTQHPARSSAGAQKLSQYIQELCPTSLEAM